MIVKSTRRQVLAGAAALLLPSIAKAGGKRPVVVELFTSQSCSSCPPADAVFDKLSDRNEVILLSYHVNYWDYLGWKDTLAKEEFSQRQYDYAHARGDMDVYTPQAIVQGSAHFVGSGAEEIQKSIDVSSADGANWVTPVLTLNGEEVQVDVPAMAGAPQCTVWLMSIIPEKKVKIERGENAGREMVYSNAVCALLPAGMWSGSPVSLKMPASTVLHKDCRKCVALVQVGKVGAIMGAGTVAVPI